MIDPREELRRMFKTYRPYPPAMIVVSQEIHDQLWKWALDSHLILGRAENFPPKDGIRFRGVIIRVCESLDAPYIRLLNREEMASFLATCEPAEMIS